MEWETIMYQKENGTIPVQDFILSLSTKHRAKAERSIQLLQENGPFLPQPYAKAISGKEYKGLWELRIQFSNDISRIFYYTHVERKIVLLHGFVKKSEATPKAELSTAKRYMEDFVRREKL